MVNPRPRLLYSGDDVAKGPRRGLLRDPMPRLLDPNESPLGLRQSPPGFAPVVPREFLHPNERQRLEMLMYAPYGGVRSEVEHFAASQNTAPQRMSPMAQAPASGAALVPAAVEPPPSQLAKDGPAVYGPNLSDAETGRRARVIFGETSGVWPALKDPNGRVHDPNNWDQASADELARARAYIGVVSERNSRTHSAKPDFSKPLDRLQWNRALEAAQASRAADGTLDPAIGRFYLRQEGSAQKIPKYDTLTPPIGPFVNVGGGDVPRGNQMYFDFFRK